MEYTGIKNNKTNSNNRKEKEEKRNPNKYMKVYVNLDIYL